MRGRVGGVGCMPMRGTGAQCARCCCAAALPAHECAPSCWPPLRLPGVDDTGPFNQVSALLPSFGPRFLPYRERWKADRRRERDQARERLERSLGTADEEQARWVLEAAEDECCRLGGCSALPGCKSLLVGIGGLTSRPGHREPQRLRHKPQRAVV